MDEFLKNFDLDRTSHLLGYSPSDCVVVSVGTIEPRKQQTVLALAFAAVTRHRPSAHHALVGRSHMHDDYFHALGGFSDKAGMKDRNPCFFLLHRASRKYMFRPAGFCDQRLWNPEIIEDRVTGFLV
jgi:hypothetical protein